MEKKNAILRKFIDNFVDEEYRHRSLLELMSIVFCVVGLVMTILNLAQQQTTLAIVTGIFSGSLLIVAILNYFITKLKIVCEAAFMLCVISLFTIFLVTGGTKSGSGFSTYWIALFPYLAFLTYGNKKGLIGSAIMLLILIFFLVTPGEQFVEWRMIEIEGVKQTNPLWTDFRVRFFFVYLAGCVTGFVMEYLRYVTAKELINVSQKYKTSAETDNLTQIPNQNSFVLYTQSLKGKLKVGSKIACMFFDLDGFKLVNDTYGHLFGNVVLKAVANTLKTYIGDGYVCRWGGDEFVALFVDCNEEEVNQIAESCRKEIESLRFDENTMARISTSVGVAWQEVKDDFRVDDIIHLADTQTSAAKESGKNRVYTIVAKR